MENRLGDIKAPGKHSSLFLIATRNKHHEKRDKLHNITMFNSYPVMTCGIV